MGISHDSSRPLIVSGSISHKPTFRSRSDSDSNNLTRTPSNGSSIDSAHREISEIEAVIEKLQNKQLSTQRFFPTEEKKEYLNKLALSAKVERALRRRMIGQDAEMRIHLAEEEVTDEKEDKLLLLST